MSVLSGVMHMMKDQEHSLRNTTRGDTGGREGVVTLNTERPK